MNRLLEPWGKGKRVKGTPDELLNGQCLSQNCGYREVTLFARKSWPGLFGKSGILSTNWSDNPYQFADVCAGALATIWYQEK